jgi:hypothetical protein
MKGRSMGNDLPLNSQQAEQLHWYQTNQGYLVMWIVTWNTSDYPLQAVARPTLVRPQELIKLYAILRADSLDRLRQMLPRNLTCLPRDPNDDVVIVEVWV